MEVAEQAITVMIGEFPAMFCDDEAVIDMLEGFRVWVVTELHPDIFFEASTFDGVVWWWQAGLFMEGCEAGHGVGPFSE